MFDLRGTRASVNLISGLLRQLIDFALPPRCAGCGIVVAKTDELCASCWTEVQYITGPGCGLCGAPIETAGQICGPCMANPPRHDGVRAATAYGGTARNIAVRLKHARRIGLARLMAQSMARLIDDDSAILIPVPLHRWRIWRRGFNQSAEIGRHLSRLSGLKLEREVLVRAKRTPVLAGLGAKERAKALRGAFKVNSGARHLIRDRHVILVDDVYTSGATGNAAALSLKRAGAIRVTLLCWARVIRDEV